MTNFARILQVSSDMMKSVNRIKDHTRKKDLDGIKSNLEDIKRDLARLELYLKQ